MKTQSYLMKNYCGDVVFSAEFFAITLQRIHEPDDEDADAPPPFRATAQEFPDIIGYGFKPFEAYASLQIQIEARYEQATAAGAPFPEPQLAG